MRKISILFTTFLSFIFICSVSAKYERELIKALEGKDFDSIKKVLEKGGVRVDSARNSNKNTAMNLAVLTEDLEIVKLLVSYGGSIDKRNKHGYTPLNFACLRYHYDISEYLIAHGANVNNADKRGFTPLMRAAYAGNLKLVQLLIENGANYKKKNDEKQTALDLAKMNKQETVAEYLSRL